MSLVVDDILTFSDGENGPVSIVLDKDKALGYFGFFVDKHQVVRVNLFSFVIEAVLVLDESSSSGLVSVIDPSAGFAYFAPALWPPRVYKVDLAMFTVVGTLFLDMDYGEPYSAVLDPVSGSIFLGTVDSPAIIVKIDLATFAEVAHIHLLPGENYPEIMVIDEQHHLAYVKTNLYLTQFVVKIDLTTFSRVARVELPQTERMLPYVKCILLDVANQRAYILSLIPHTPGGGGGVYSIIIIIDLLGMTYLGMLDFPGRYQLPTGEVFGEFAISGVIDAAGAYAYFTTGYSGDPSYHPGWPNGGITELSTAALTITDVLPFEADQLLYAHSSAIVSDPFALYFADDSSPARLMYVRRLSVVDHLPLLGVQ